VVVEEEEEEDGFETEEAEVDGETSFKEVEEDSDLEG